jgi:hypothetical protein
MALVLRPCRRLYLPSDVDCWPDRDTMHDHHQSLFESLGLPQLCSMCSNKIAGQSDRVESPELRTQQKPGSRNDVAEVALVLYHVAQGWRLAGVQQGSDKTLLIVAQYR